MPVSVEHMLASFSGYHEGANTTLAACMHVLCNARGAQCVLDVMINVQVTPKFCKQYAQVGLLINDGLTSFRKDVEYGQYPSAATSPYRMSEEELAIFSDLLHEAGLPDSSKAALLGDLGSP
jgi:hypothetical protein